MVVDYTANVQSSSSGESQLPELRYDDWSWLVLDLEVAEGELDMEIDQSMTSNRDCTYAYANECDTGSISCN